MSKISVVIIAQNEAHRIEAALKSVQWADEIVIIDAFSTDGTVGICKKYTDKIFQYNWEGFARQRMRSLEHASHLWVLSLDADEAVSEELRDEILEVVAQNGHIHGYEIPRKTYYLGRWIEHSGWFPDYQLRLFQKDKVHLEPRLVHEGYEVAGISGRLKGVLFHYAFESIYHHVAKINRYTSLDCSQKMVRLRNTKIRWYHFVFNPLSKFLRMFLVNKGYKDGIQGFILAIFSAFSTQLLYTKVWEEQTQQRQNLASERQTPME